MFRCILHMNECKNRSNRRLPLRTVIVGQDPTIPLLRGRALRTSVTLIPPLRYGTALRAGAPIPSLKNTRQTEQNTPAFEKFSVCFRRKVGVNFYIIIPIPLRNSSPTAHSACLFKLATRIWSPAESI